MPNNELQILAKKKYIFEKVINNTDHPVFGKKIVIPSFQRPYSWKSEHIKELIKDFYENINKEYYVGNITVVCINDNEVEIIDGQQRLTSCLLIGIWLRNYFSNENNSKILNYNKYIRTASRDHFVMSSPDCEIFKKISMKNSSDDILAYLKSDQELNDEFFKNQKSLFFSVFNEINRLMQDYTIDEKKSLYCFLFEKLYCLSIEDSSHGDHGNQLFISLNGKGKELDEIDLVKSFFVKPFISGDSCDIDNDISYFKEQWGKLIINTSNNLGQVMSSYFILKNKKWLEKLKDKNENGNFDVRKEFISFCEWCERNKEILKFKTRSKELNFFLKLNKKMNYFFSDEILFKFYDKFREDYFKNYFLNLLKNMIKINFLYLTFDPNGNSSTFDKEIISCCSEIIKRNEKNENFESRDGWKKLFNEINNFLVNKMNEKLNFPINNDEKIKNFLTNELLYSNKNDRSIFFFLNSIQKAVPNINAPSESSYGSACTMIEKYQIDHFIPSKTPIWIGNDTNDSKSLYEWKKRDGSYVFFHEASPLRNVLEQLNIGTENLSKLTFDNLFINKVFNLRLIDDETNIRRQNKVQESREHILDHFCDRKIKERGKTLFKYFEFFFKNSES